MDREGLAKACGKYCREYGTERGISFLGIYLIEEAQKLKQDVTIESSSGASVEVKLEGKNIPINWGKIKKDMKSQLDNQLEEMFTFQENNLKNVPDVGGEYIVLYHDCHTGEKRMATGLWDSELFVFHGSIFVNKDVSPSIEKANNRHHILGWSKISNWRENNED